MSPSPNPAFTASDLPPVYPNDLPDPTEPQPEPDTYPDPTPFPERDPDLQDPGQVTPPIVA